jgi:pterin-4a-carbinolamine dehydratase
MYPLSFYVSMCLKKHHQPLLFLKYTGTQFKAQAHRITYVPGLSMYLSVSKKRHQPLLFLKYTGTQFKAQAHRITYVPFVLLCTYVFQKSTINPSYFLKKGLYPLTPAFSPIKNNLPLRNAPKSGEIFSALISPSKLSADSFNDFPLENSFT